MVWELTVAAESTAVSRLSKEISVVLFEPNVLFQRRLIVHIPTERFT